MELETQHRILEIAAKQAVGRARRRFGKTHDYGTTLEDLHQHLWVACLAMLPTFVAGPEIRVPEARLMALAHVTCARATSKFFARGVLRHRAREVSTSIPWKTYKPVTKATGASNGGAVAHDLAAAVAAAHRVMDAMGPITAAAAAAALELVAVGDEPRGRQARRAWAALKRGVQEELA